MSLFVPLADFTRLYSLVKNRTNSLDSIDRAELTVSFSSKCLQRMTKCLKDNWTYIIEYI